MIRKALTAAALAAGGLALAAGTAAAGPSYVTVRAGDTLWGIAAAHGTTWQRLAADNRLAAPNLIFPGERIYLEPTSTPSAVVYRPAARAWHAPAQPVTHQQHAATGNVDPYFVAGGGQCGTSDTASLPAGTVTWPVTPAGLAACTAAARAAGDPVVWFDASQPGVPGVFCGSTDLRGLPAGTAHWSSEQACVASQR